MLKQLTLAAFAAALLPACILTTDNTTTDDSASGSATDGTGTTGTASGTTTSTASDTTTGDSSTTVDVPTTDGPTTDATTTDATDATTTVGTTTTDGTTGSSAYGMCGWVESMKFYACAADGAAPGVEDPAGIDPIACGDGVVEGADCTDKEGPVKNIGCCAENGDLFLCDTQGDDPTLKIIKVSCGA